MDSVGNGQKQRRKQPEVVRAMGDGRRAREHRERKGGGGGLYNQNIHTHEILKQ